MSAESRHVSLRPSATLEPAAQWAIDELAAALTKRNWVVSEAADLTVQIGLGGDAPKAPESLSIRRVGEKQLSVCGADEHGLVYALTELEQAVLHDATDVDPFAGVTDTVEQPALAWRSVQVFLNNKDLEEGWYFDDGYWQWYLGMLVRCRFNNLSLTFCHQTSYLAPPFPFHVPLPEFPQVRTPGFDQAQRERHLEQLRRVSQLARHRGLHFTLGIWQQHDNGYGDAMVEGLDEDIRADCNALGLYRMLEACPDIDGLQLRMNYEAGVPENQQGTYWQKQFDAIAKVGRPIRVDVRAKGLSDRTIEIAQKALDHVVVSTKFWCEHLGMPYLMPAIQQFDVPHYRRYGPWDLLHKSRSYDLVYRLWTFGTQRVLQWGHTDYIRRFARSCAANSEGFEVMAPLTNKGGRNVPAPDQWRVIADTDIQPFAWEQERYWRFYQLFGRIGYNAGTSAVACRREMTYRFGSAATSIESAFEATGSILPLITTVMQFAASAWAYWPELFAGRSLIEDARIEPSDPTQFYGVEEYVAAALLDELDGRWTPFQIAAHLHGLADATRQQLEGVEPVTSELRGTLLDLNIQADLADYHAHRLTAMAHWHVFERTRRTPRLERAIEQMEKALNVWCQLSERTDGVYHDDLTFGRTDFEHVGHWKDRLPKVEEELRELTDRRDQTPLVDSGDEPIPGEEAYPEVAGIEIDLPKHVEAGQPLEIAMRVPATVETKEVICLHKPQLQTLPFRHALMTPHGESFSVEIAGQHVPADFNMLFMFELHLADGRSLRWPGWRIGDPFVVVHTE